MVRRAVRILLDCAGSVELDAPRRVFEICRPVRVTSGESWAELLPLGSVTRAAQPVLEMDLSIDFAATAIGRQSVSLRLTPDNFRNESPPPAPSPKLRRWRSFRPPVWRAAVVWTMRCRRRSNILNSGGLRMANEFASHKLLDAVGDLALAGVRLHGHFAAYRPGHGLNNRLLRALFADAAASAQGHGRTSYRRRLTARTPVFADRAGMI